MDGNLALLVRWATITLGCIYFITESSIFAWLRMWIASRGSLAEIFIYCPACTGFWIGGLTGWFWPYGTETIPGSFLVESAIAAMALGAVWSAWRGGNPAYSVEQEDEEPEE